MLGVIDFSVSYVPVDVIRSHCVIILITSAEGLIRFVLEISYDFQNTILPNPAEIVYLSLPYLYLDWYKIKFLKHPLVSINQKELCIQAIKSIQVTKPAVKLGYDLLKSFFITIKIIRRSSNHAVVSWVYKNYKSFLNVEIDDILMAIENRIFFERL